MSTDAEVVGGSARLEDPIEAANHYFDYLDEHQMGLHGGGSGTNPDTGTGTGTDTTPETGNDAVVAGKAPKKKRTRRPNELGIGQIVVTEMHPKKLEPTAPEEARSCWGNQLGCILRETANINDEKLKKIPHMEHMLLKKLHNRFLFPGRDEGKYKEPWDDVAMTKINDKAMVTFTNDLSSWKVRVKKAIAKNEPWSKIHADNPTIMEEDFAKFKENCGKEEVKAKSEKMKALQARNTPPHRLGSRGYEGKRHIWAKEDAERESHGIPDPLAEFTDPLEHDWIRARYKWDKVKKIFYTDPNTREFMRLLVIVILPHYHISFQSIRLQVLSH